MILFRADGNEIIGLGHIMRCLSIAEALREKSAEVVFAVSDNKCESLITQKGFDCVVLNTDYSDLDSEAEAFGRLLDRLKPQSVIVDSYYVTRDYLEMIGQKAITVYIDDILAFDYPADILINYNIFSSKSDYDKLYRNSAVKPEFLLGTRFVPLRHEFSGCEYRRPRETVRNILVSTGGADTEHIGISFLSYLKDNPDALAGYRLKFVAGAVNRDIDRIKELAEALPYVDLLIGVKDMKSLLCDCDMAVSAAGSTLYELCACSVPSITYVVADNQLPAAEAFSKKGIMENLGDMRVCRNIGETIAQSAKQLAEDYDRRESMAKIAFEQINKNGSAQIAEYIIDG